MTNYSEELKSLEKELACSLNDMWHASVAMNEIYYADCIKRYEKISVRMAEVIQKEAEEAGAK